MSKIIVPGEDLNKYEPIKGVPTPSYSGCSWEGEKIFFLKKVLPVLINTPAPMTEAEVKEKEKAEPDASQPTAKFIPYGERKSRKES